MPKESAGLLLYRKRRGSLEVFLVHPGGPFWVNKDDGAWSIPKGEFDPDEDPLEAEVDQWSQQQGLQAGQFKRVSDEFTRRMGTNRALTNRFGMLYAQG